MKPQRKISAKLIWLRAPITKAPITANRIKPYIASAEKRVKNHMNISKLSPRLAKGRTLGFTLAMSTSQRRLNDHEGGNPKDRNKDRPFHPDGFLLMLQHFGPQIEDRNAQSIDGVEQHAEENKDLEKPVFINMVQRTSNISSKK